MRPNLTKDISVESFKDFYWLKEELQSFCRNNGISASGSKIEITKRIEIFLQTGEIKKPVRKSTSKKVEPQVDLCLDTVIMENHRCSQNVRCFLRQLSPTFTFRPIFKTFSKTMSEKHIVMQ